MYASCLFCSSTLGTNQVLEHMPVGRRLAYDPGRGRLWVVCPRCGRWNLCPFDERWETLEDCERLSRTALLRESTDSIALLEHRSKLSLIRVGKPPLSELVTWRFARSLVRRRRSFVLGAGVAGAAGAVGTLGLAVGGGIGLSLLSLYVTGRVWVSWLKPVIRMTTGDGVQLRITEPAARGVSFDAAAPQGPALRVLTRKAGFQEVRGADIPVLLARAMPYINDTGGTKALALNAAAMLSEKGGPEGFLEAIARDTKLHRSAVLRPSSARLRREGAVYKFPRPLRLALEAASHMEQEERFHSGELEAVMAEWRTAEELADISDSLLEPPGWHPFRKQHGGSSEP